MFESDSSYETVEVLQIARNKYKIVTPTLDTLEGFKTKF